MIDVETNQVLSLEITDEKPQDDEIFLSFLNQVKDLCGEGVIDKVLADGVYDRKSYLMT
jgi:hypothetical protein